MATDTAGAIIEGIDTAGAIIEVTARLRSEPEEVVDAVTGSTGTKPIPELEALPDC